MRKIFECPTCGYKQYDEAPTMCPECGTAKNQFAMSIEKTDDTQNIQQTKPVSQESQKEEKGKKILNTIKHFLITFGELLVTVVAILYIVSLLSEIYDFIGYTDENISEDIFIFIGIVVIGLIYFASCKFIQRYNLSKVKAIVIPILLTIVVFFILLVAYLWGIAIISNN